MTLITSFTFLKLPVPIIDDFIGSYGTMVVRAVMSARVMNITIILLAINMILGLGSFAAFTQDSFSQTSTATNALRFSEPVNLTNNAGDSVYAQVASHEKNIYVVWQENPPPTADNDNSINYNSINYDIFIKKSIDAGLTFDKEINLSNNPGFSEHPQIATSGNNVYVVWIDNTLSTDPSSETTANKKIMFRKSADNGNTFGETITLSNITADSFNQEIAATGNNVYVVWQVTSLPNADQDEVSTDNSEMDTDNNSDPNSVGGSSSVSFVSSGDSGETFGEIKNLTDSAFKSYPKVAAYGNKVYVIWNIGIIGNSVNRETGSDNNNNGMTGNGIFLTKSLDNGRSFGKTIKLNADSDPVGESQVAAYENNVYIVWGGNPDDKVAGNLFYASSSNNGTGFTTARPLTGRDTLNVEVAARNDTVYIAWQGVLPNGNEEIYIKRSSDAGVTFPNPTENISKNSGISECTSIVISGGIGKVYLIWEDSPAGNHEILFARSI